MYVCKSAKGVRGLAKGGHTMDRAGVEGASVLSVWSVIWSLPKSNILLDSNDILIIVNIILYRFNEGRLLTELSYYCRF